jgi:hypothetical protein
MVDLENLERYILIQTGKQSPVGIEDLRELDGDFGHGVHPLWSDGLNSIVAFAFEPNVFDEKAAREWVKKAQEKREMSVVEIFQDVVKSLSGLLFSGPGKPRKPSKPRKPRKPTQAVNLRGFNEIRRLVDQALETWLCPASIPGGVTSGEYPWIVEIGPNTVIFEWMGQRYACSYSISEDEEVTLGEMEKVEEQYVREDNSPVLLHSFAVRLSAGDDAEEDDGLIWKEIIHPGKWFKMDTGSTVEITEDIIEEVFAAFEAGLPKLISVPADSHHEWDGGIVPPESNRGFVKKLKMIDGRLFGGFVLTDPVISFGVEVGNIADCSVSIVPDVIHPETGETFPWMLQHVLLTNDPLVQDLAPFGVAASSVDGPFLVVSYKQEEVINMAKQQSTVAPQPVVVAPEPVAPAPLALSAQDQAVLTAAQSLSLSAEDIQAMVTERQSVRTKARDLEITRIIRALEGVEKHDQVVQVEGYRHQPVVCEAVERVLREQPEALSLSANDEGQTSIDALVLEILNAIPQEGRLQLSAGEPPEGDPQPEKKDPTLQDGESVATDEQIDELDARLR